MITGYASESNTGTPALPAVSRRRGPVRRFAHGSADPGDLDTVQAQRAGQRDGPAGAAKDSDVDRAWDPVSRTLRRPRTLIMNWAAVRPGTQLAKTVAAS